jgi:16S rRNA (cytosine967-C5)-methyltransferase
VEAVELDNRRAERIQQNLQRLKLSCTVTLGDASSDSWWDGQSYDRILIDAPCSATGVIRRHPDIKYLRRNEDLKRLADTQLSILQNCWKMLSPGGKLLYATCSVFPQENERLLARFIKAQPDEVLHQPIDANWGHARPLGRQLFPQQDGHDGFYYAVLEKPAN